MIMPAKLNVSCGSQPPKSADLAQYLHTFVWNGMKEIMTAANAILKNVWKNGFHQIFRDRKNLGQLYLM